ncbi:unnamed protein product [Moneuplotes crassus]|uniref:Mago nashi-like protein n=1 Tax=Euplotes crassus TaxID=5936 RepID=A0AAD2D6V3_EUPCR|nr:unnamed protein product [Moneuplotes crassus]
MRYYVGHKGKYGHEFLEFEVNSEGRLRYANNSNYKSETMIRKEVYLTEVVVEVLQNIIKDSDVMDLEKEHPDAVKDWPAPDRNGKQELEIILGGQDTKFTTSKFSSLVGMDEHLTTLYYLVQDIKSLIFSLLNLKFRINPINAN